MVALPPSTDFTDAARTEGQVKTFITDTRSYLSGLLGTDGEPATGRSTLVVGVKGGDIASASPLVIDTDGDYFDVTGTTGFAAMTVAANRHFFLQFDGALTMTHHATNLDLPGEANITTAAGDVGEFFSTGANTVQCVNYTKADGKAVVATTGFPAPDFTSSEQTVTASTLLNVAHSLSVVPRLVQVGLRCKTTDATYSVGDEVIYTSLGSGNGADTGHAVGMDSTNVFIVQASVIHIVRKTTFLDSSITVGNWKWEVRAWK